MVQKWPFFQFFFFRQYRPGKYPLRYSSWKNNFLGYKNKKIKKSKNWHFPKRVNPWFWSKNGHYSNLYFWGNIGKENVFYDNLERRNAFLCYKNKKFKKSKIEIFLKGFGAKMVISPTFSLRQYRPAKCLLWYSRAKKRFSRL